MLLCQSCSLSLNKRTIILIIVTQIMDTAMNLTAMPELYQELATGALQPLLTALSGGKALIGVVGIMMNLELVFVTASSPSLNGFCNCLIAADALCEAIYEFSFIISFIVLASGLNLISLSTCFYAQLVPSFMKYFSAGLMVAIGLNRLKSVLFAFGKRMPRWARRASQCCWFFPYALLSAYLMGLSYKCMLPIQNKQVMCTTSEISQGASADVTYICALLLNLASPVIYCLLGIALYIRNKKFAQQAQECQDKTGKIFKSIFVIMIVQLLGWGSNALIQLSGGNFDSHYASKSVKAWNIVGSYPLAIATAANGPILYFCSYEYRKAFNGHLSKVTNSLFGEFSTNQIGTSIRVPNSIMRSRYVSRTVPLTNL